MEDSNTFASELKEVELSLSRIILTKLDKGEITFDQSQDIARDILSKIDEVKDPQQLLAFLNSLYQKWPIFENTYSLYRIRINDLDHSRQALEKVESELAQIKK